MERTFVFDSKVDSDDPATRERIGMATKMIIMPGSLNKNDAGIFAYHPNLTEVIFMDGVSIIPRYAFDGCTLLKKVTFPKTPIKCEDYAFQSCGFLQITIFANVELGTSVFTRCIHLTEVIIMDNVLNIPFGTFLNCVELRTIKFPRTVITCDSYSFTGCAFTKLIIPGNVVLRPRMFEGCEELVALTMGDGITHIPENTFKGCGWLKCIVIPKSMLTIDAKAFAGCSLATVYAYTTDTPLPLAHLFPEAEIRSIEMVKKNLSDALGVKDVSDNILEYYLDCDGPEEEKKQSGGYIFTKKQYLKLTKV